MTIVERVARAIAYAEGDDYSESSSFFEKAARAALEAMREPTPNMYIKGGIAIYDAKPNAETAADESAACWHAMIDAALAEEQV